LLVPSPKYRRPLNVNQIRLLKLLYKFRFVSVPLLSDYLGRDKSSVYENLFVLGKQGFVAKRYDKSYKLLGKPASYHLAAGGIKYLRDKTKASHSVLRNMYKNKIVSQVHIDHCLQVFALYSALNTQTNSGFNQYTRYELAGSELFPNPLPDLYLERKRTKAGKPFDYTLDIFEASTPFFVLKKRLRAYQDHCDEAMLPDETYPYVLIAVANERTEQRLLRFIESAILGFEAYTTTTERILDWDKLNPAIWKDIFEEDENDQPLLRCL